jgi:fatty acid desaturase
MSIANTIDKSILKDLHQVSTWRGIFGIFSEWVLIVAIVIAAIRIDQWWFHVLAILFITGRQHALAFMVHEGVHYLVSRKRKLNDFLVNVFAAWPLFMNIQSYRRNHLAHHQYINTDQDPDWIRKQDGEWVFPMQGSLMFKLFVKSFFGLYSIQSFKALAGKDEAAISVIEKEKVSYLRLVLRLSYYAVVVGLALHFDFWKEILFFWFLPLFTWLQVLNRLRKLAEHFGVYGLPAEVTTRTVIPNWWERIFIAPKNIYYHNEHHYFTGVPYYSLDRLHVLLKEHEPYCSESHVTRGYWNVLRECMGKKAS